MTSPASGADSAPDPPGYAPAPRSVPGTQSVTGHAASPVASAGDGNRRLGLALLVIATAQRLQACFSLLARQRTKKGTLIAASTVDRIRATLRSALNAAVREGIIASNPLAQVRLDKPVRPHPVIWTDERVAAWRRDGIRPSRAGCWL